MRRDASWYRAPVALILLAAGLGCSARAPESAPVAVASLSEPADGDLESRALLLLLADRKLFEPEALGLLLDRSAAVREGLAVALGRIGDPRGRSLLQGLLVDSEPAVRRAAAFALGELGAVEAIPALRTAAVDDDPECGTLAVEALGKLGAPLADVRRLLGALEARQAELRLAPHLFRFREPSQVEAAVTLLASADPEVRAGAAYALGREARPEGLAALRTLLADADPFVRAWAARGLGSVGGAEDLAPLLPLAGEAEASPRIQALAAAGRIRARTDAVAPPEWRPTLLLAFDAELPGIRAAALEAAGAFLPAPELEAALTRRFRAGPVRERELALAALVEGAAAAARELVTEAVGAGEAALRAQAARGAGRLGDIEQLERLEGDAAPAVRRALFEARAELAGEGPELAQLLAAALADPDPTVRATALDLAAATSVLPAARLVEALGEAARDRELDARLAAIRALSARAENARPDRQEVLGALERAATDREYLVRREAADALAALGLERPAVTPIDTGRDVATYRAALLQAAERPVVALETERGRVEIRLECPEAPLTCLSFLKLAEQGFFDGVPLHRVVPDFVVQGGDPRGDGWGGPGYTLRDEVNRWRYRRGAVGMALSGPDTGGSQFFVTLSPQPHLDGGFTLFGTVVAGLERLDRLAQGDRILSARRVD